MNYNTVLILVIFPPVWLRWRPSETVQCSFWIVADFDYHHIGRAGRTSWRWSNDRLRYRWKNIQYVELNLDEYLPLGLYRGKGRKLWPGNHPRMRVGTLCFHFLCVCRIVVSNRMIQILKKTPTAYNGEGGHLHIRKALPASGSNVYQVTQNNGTRHNVIDYRDSECWADNGRNPAAERVTGDRDGPAIVAVARAFGGIVFAASALFVLAVQQGVNVLYNRRMEIQLQLEITTLEA